MPPKSENVVHPCFLQMSQSLLLVNLRLMTEGMFSMREGTSVTDWALPWVSDNPV